jgi:signal transduction histidine kinase
MFRERAESDGLVGDVLRSEAALGVGIGDDILVVDDSAPSAIAIAAAIEPLGRRIVVAHSGIEALGKMLEQDFALILLDVAMPALTGIETARLVRSRERSRGTPIIFITGKTWEDDAIDEAYEAGGFDFMIKPVRPEVLRAKARVFLQLQERTRELRDSQARLHEHELAEQRKQFESALLEAKVQQLAEHERQRDELVAILGHELRNPLQLLQLTFDLLREHPNAEKTERVFALLDRRFTHVTRLVEDLLDVARTATGQLALHAEPLDLGGLVHQALDDCRGEIESRNHTLRVNTANVVPPMVLGDSVRLVQVLASLIDNAARYTPDEGTIEIAVTVESGDVVATVADTGRGIPAELLERIFDMFVRERAATDGSGGLGLGLGLAKRLIELHDGTIAAASEGIGKGSKFEIRLPLAPQELELSALSVDNARPTVRLAALDAESLPIEDPD